MGSIRKRPDRRKPYLARYRGPDGRERSKSFRRRVDAQRWITQHERAKDRHDWIDPALGSLPVDALVDDFLATRVHLRASTRIRDAGYFKTLVLPHFGSTSISSLDSSAIRAWVAGLHRQGYAGATIRRAYQLLAAVLNRAVDDGLIARTPCRGIELPPVVTPEKRFLTHSEVTDLADAIEPRYRTLVSTGAYTGLRPGELYALTTRDLDLERRILRVTRTLQVDRGAVSFGPPKTTAARRTVAIPDSLGKALEEHRSVHSSETDLVFTAPEGGPIRPSLFRRRVWYPAVEASVGRPMRPHDLRHTHAALLIAEGTDPYVVSKRLGHTSIKTTYDHYGHLFEGIDERAVEALERARHRSQQQRTEREPPGLDL